MSARSDGRIGWVALVVGAVVLGVVLAMAWSGAPDASPPPAAMSGAGDASTIDLSTMTPRQRFDRLYDRVMRSSEGGDDAAVAQFAPMALAAYAQLDQVDADARYHAAMIRMHTGDPTGAAALGDSIRIADSSHLFSYIVHGTLARQRNDQARMREEQVGFLRHYESEMAAKREEYKLHTFILDQFVSEARAAKQP